MENRIHFRFFRFSSSIMSDTSSKAMQAILDHLQLLSADLNDLRMEMRVRFDGLSKRIDRNAEKIDRNSKLIDRNSKLIERNTEKIDRNHRAVIEGAKEREGRIVRLEKAVFA